jgi:hypothetical protein
MTTPLTKEQRAPGRPKLQDPREWKHMLAFTSSEEQKLIWEAEKRGMTVNELIRSVLHHEFFYQIGAK